MTWYSGLNDQKEWSWVRLPVGSLWSGYWVTGCGTIWTS